jgi:hypothetical protein
LIADVDQALLIKGDAGWLLHTRSQPAGHFALAFECAKPEQLTFGDQGDRSLNLIERTDATS